MNTAVRKLTKAERAHLSNLWEDKDTLHSLNAALSRQQLILALQEVSNTTDFNQVMLLRGQIMGLTWIMDFLEQNHQKVKESKKEIKEAESETTYSQ